MIDTGDDSSGTILETSFLVSVKSSNNVTVDEEDGTNSFAARDDKCSKKVGCSLLLPLSWSTNAFALSGATNSATTITSSKETNK